jgi:hypothetical protein
MNKEDTATFLTVVSTHYQNFQLSPEIVSGWHLVVQPFSKADIWRAYQNLRSRGPEFAPNPGQVEAECLRLAANVGSGDAELAWSMLYGSDKVKKSQLPPFAAEAWHAWGGRKRWAALPDPDWSKDRIQAQQTISFARKEYLDIFKSLAARGKEQQVALTHDQSQKLLDDLNFTTKGISYEG